MERRRHVAVWQHADGGGVDQAVRAGERLFGRRADMCGAVSVQCGGEFDRPRRVAIDDVEAADAAFGQRDANRLADAAGADQGDRLPGDIADFPSHAAFETAAIGVEADQPPVAHRDTILTAPTFAAEGSSSSSSGTTATL